MDKTTDTEKKQILWKILYGMQSTKQETKQETKKIKKKQDETDEDIYCVVQKEEENNPSEDDENENLRLLRKAFNGIFSIISVEEFFLKNEDTPDFCDKFINTYTENIKKEIDDLIKEKTRKKKCCLKCNLYSLYPFIYSFIFCLDRSIVLILSH